MALLGASLVPAVVAWSRSLAADQTLSRYGFHPGAVDLGPQLWTHMFVYPDPFTAFQGILALILVGRWAEPLLGSWGTVVVFILGSFSAAAGACLSGGAGPWEAAPVLFGAGAGVLALGTVVLFLGEFAGTWATLMALTIVSVSPLGFEAALGSIGVGLFAAVVVALAPGRSGG